MKKATKVLALLLSMTTLCLSGLSVTSTAEQSATEIISSEFNALRQEISSDLVTSLLQEVGGSDGLHADLGFAGMYVNEYGQLIIGVTKEPSSQLKTCIQALPLNSIVSQSIQEYQAELSETSNYSTQVAALNVRDFTEDCLQIQEMNYAYAYLKNLQDALLDYHVELGIYETALLDAENCLKIQIEDDNNRKAIINWLSENIDDFDEKAVNIVVKPNTISFSSSISNTNANVASTYGFIYGSAYPGTKVATPISPGSNVAEGGTLGFCAMDRETSNYGIVTNAHLFSGTTELWASGIPDIDSDCNFLGYVYKTQQEGNLDAAFVTYSNRYAWGSTYQIQSSNGSTIRRVATDDEYYAGTVVYKYGMVTGYQTGLIISSSVNITMPDGITYADVIKYEATRADGDSGAPVFRSDSTGQNYLIGIHFSGSSNVCYSIKIEHILQQFSLEEYTEYRRGDINLDQTINSTDSNQIMQLAAGRITVNFEQMMISDVDFNGIVNTTDARIVLQRVS